MSKDIFISYRNDGLGNSFAEKLADDLRSLDYSVYFNSDERESESFEMRIRATIARCKDFLVIVTQGCLDGLLSHKGGNDDWVREEILEARRHESIRITPVYLNGVRIPSVNDFAGDPEMAFFPLLDGVPMPADTYDASPLDRLTDRLKSERSGSSDYRDEANGNQAYDVYAEYQDTKRRAEAGDLTAAYELGCMYYYGFCSEDGPEAKPDYARAYEWFTKVSCAGIEFSGAAKGMIAEMYYAGLVPYEELSFQRARELLSSSEVSDSEWSLERLLAMTSDGVGMRFDMPAVLKLFDKHRSHCSATAKNNMAKFYEKYGMFQEAISILEEIEGVFPDAAYRLGMLYLRGLHTQPPSPDVFRAIAHLENASQGGNLNATHALGLIYFRGTHGYRQDLSRARNLFRIAAERGHRGGQYDYAWMCRNGQGGERDLETALRYFVSSAEKGHVAAMAELATLYQEAACRNYQRAYEWAIRAAEADDPRGEFVLGCLLLFGRGCKPDENRAAIYLKKASEHGMLQAKLMLQKVVA